MKRIGNLYQSTFTPERLYQAYIDARRHKRGTRACFTFERSLGSNLAALHQELHDGAYRPKPYFCFVIKEPKERTIYAPSFRDCVVQHAIYRTVQPVFDATFIATSFACRPGYGTHRASRYLQQAMCRCRGDDYFLQLDVKRYFYSIDRTVLRELLERRVKDTRLIDTMMAFASTDSPLGIPIGSLLSQLYALVYLNPIDHYIKRSLGVRFYARHMDDLVLVGLDRTGCLRHRDAVREFLAHRLRLQLSKATLQQIRRGANYVGFRTWRSGRFIRKHALYKFRRAVKQSNVEVAVSLLAHARHTRSLQYMLDTAKELNYGLYRQIPASHRRLHHPHSRPACQRGRPQHSGPDSPTRRV